MGLRVGPCLPLLPSCSPASPLLPSFLLPSFSDASFHHPGFFLSLHDKSENLHWGLESLPVGDREKKEANQTLNYSQLPWRNLGRGRNRVTEPLPVPSLSPLCGVNIHHSVRQPSMAPVTPAETLGAVLGSCLSTPSSPRLEVLLAPPATYTPGLATWGPWSALAAPAAALPECPGASLLAPHVSVPPTTMSSQHAPASLPSHLAAPCPTWRSTRC